LVALRRKIRETIVVVQFADEKTTWKILQQARQQQEELQEEFGVAGYLQCYLLLHAVCISF